MADKLQLQNKSVLISGADSGIGKAVALLFAKEGANIGIIYHTNDKDAEDAKDEIEKLGRKATLFSGDVNNFQFCKMTVNKIVSEFGTLDILINNAGVQFPCDDILDLQEDHIRETFNANIIGMILLTKAAFPHLKMGDCVINTTSATAYQGHKQLLDYSATKGAIVSFTRSLALQSKSKGIRVNAVAPGPVATPLTEKTFNQKEEDSKKPPLERNATEEEIAGSFLFLATDSATQITAQVIHPNGGLIVNG
ncbi:SDR family oxidoreductase [Epilithonimonas sp.]|uniref:SDR family oxidoreductase n=1 Tax=Epilithonimonas sp. TaxID=2894511 RepID=UPI002898AE14|nr:SDR family oxidoreductase [Epilithonimonas sp.]